MTFTITLCHVAGFFAITGWGFIGFCAYGAYRAHKRQQGLGE